MMRRRTTSWAGVFTAAMIALSCAPMMMGGDRAADEAAIRSLSMGWQQAFAARDIDRIVALYAPDAVLAPPNAPSATGVAAIREAWSGFLGMNPSLTWQPTRITVAASGDVATEVGTYQMSFDTPGGRVNDRGTYAVVWNKVGNDWRVVSDVGASAMPMAPLPPPMAVHVVFDTSSVAELVGAGQLNWGPFSPPGFPAGAQMTVLHGNPASSGDYVLRVRFPDGYRVPLHWHSKAEHVTVLSGEFNLGMGTDASGPTRAYGMGDFAYLPPRMPHYGWARGATVLQLHGIGPFQINLGAPPAQ